MIIKIISIGNKLNSWESECIEYYKKQLPRNFKIEFINLKSQQNPKYSKDEVIMNESKLLMSKISKDDFVVAWDSMGEQNNSKKFSNFLKSFEEINQNICFVIGGSFGLSLDIKNNADKVFSASLLTFPHRLFRLILVEQIYRAHTIISNMPYHK